MLIVTSEALRAKIDLKSAFSQQERQYLPNFPADGDVPTNHEALRANID